MVKSTTKLNQIKDVDRNLYDYLLSLVVEPNRDTKAVTLSTMDPAIYYKAAEYCKNLGIAVSDLVNYLLVYYFYKPEN